MPSLAALPNYCVNPTHNGVAAAGGHFILARSPHAAVGGLPSWLGHAAQISPAVRKMDLDSYVNLGISGIQGALSWLFVAAVAIKVLSTALGIAAKKSQFFAFARGNTNWVLSKLSALTACFAAWALCIDAQDVAGTILFGFLLLIAVIAVAIMGFRRLCLVKGSAS